MDSTSLKLRLNISPNISWSRGRSNFCRIARIGIAFGLTSGTAINTYANTPLCFDFNQTVKAPLVRMIPGNPDKDTSDSGKLEGTSRTIWGAARGEVNLPIQKVYEALLDHGTIKNPKKVDFKVYPQEHPGYQDFHVLMIKAKIPLFDIRWEEEWAYLVTRGTPPSPEEVVISYQKTNGTSYLPHLCGSIVLNKSSAATTNVFLYEEVDAMGRRTPQEAVKGHLGTLATLRKISSKSLN